MELKRESFFILSLPFFIAILPPNSGGSQVQEFPALCTVKRTQGEALQSVPPLTPRFPPGSEEIFIKTAEPRNKFSGHRMISFSCLL